MRTRKEHKNRITIIGSVLAAAMGMAFGLTGCGEEAPKITETVMEGVESSLSEDRGITMYYVEGSSIKTRPERLQPKQPDLPRNMISRRIRKLLSMQENVAVREI